MSRSLPSTSGDHKKAIKKGHLNASKAARLRSGGDALPVNVRDDGYWEWFSSKQPPDYKITGKYLFFSQDRSALVSVALNEIQRFGFHCAKINKEPITKGRDLVLCLYYKDESRKFELHDRYAGATGLRYRYWKSEAATRKGEYSEEFLEALPEGKRRRFEGRR